MFERRHYRLLAKVLSDTRPSQSNYERTYQWELTRRSLCLMFDENDMRFDRRKFEDATVTKHGGSHEE